MVPTWFNKCLKDGSCWVVQGHASKHMCPKQNSNRLYGSFRMGQQMLLAEEANQYKCFFYITGHVATASLEQHSIVISEWYTSNLFASSNRRNPSIYMKSNNACVNTDSSLDYSQIFSNLHYRVCMWQEMKANNHKKIGENRIRWIICAQ